MTAQIRRANNLAAQWTASHREGARVLAGLAALAQQLVDAELVNEDDVESSGAVYAPARPPHPASILAAVPGLETKLLAKLDVKRATLAAGLVVHLRDMRRCYMELQDVHDNAWEQYAAGNIKDTLALAPADALALMEDLVRVVGAEFLQVAALIEALRPDESAAGLQRVAQAWDALHAQTTVVITTLAHREAAIRLLS